MMEYLMEKQTLIERRAEISHFIDIMRGKFNPLFQIKFRTVYFLCRQVCLLNSSISVMAVLFTRSTLLCVLPNITSFCLFI